MTKKKIIIIAVVVVLALALLIVLTKKPGTKPSEGEQTTQSGNENVPAEMLENQSEEAAEETQKLINEIIDEQGGLENAEIISIGGSSESEMLTGEVDENGEPISTTTETVAPIQAIEIVSGSSLVNIKTGEVIKDDGEKVDNAAKPASQDAPAQSFPMTSTEDLPSTAIKLEVTSNSFTPNTFTVKRGQVVTLAVTNVNTTTFSEVFRFDDESLKAVVIGLAKGQTKSIVFNAPTTAGEYTFYSSMFNHREMGAEGKMIVE